MKILNSSSGLSGQTISSIFDTRARAIGSGGLAICARSASEIRVKSGFSSGGLGLADEARMIFPRSLPVHSFRYTSKFSAIFLKPPSANDPLRRARIGPPVIGPGVDALQASGMTARRAYCGAIISTEYCSIDQLLPKGPQRSM